MVDDRFRLMRLIKSISKGRKKIQMCIIVRALSQLNKNLKIGKNWAKTLNGLVKKIIVEIILNEK